MAPLAIKLRNLVERADKPGSLATIDVANLAPSVLAQLPALAPPPGVKSNFVNPKTIGGIMIAFAIIGIVVLFTCVAVRGWVLWRLRSPRRWAWSDTFFTAAGLAALTIFVDLIIVANVGFGHHQYDLPLSDVVLNRAFFKSSAVIGLMTPLAFGFIKITIFLTYIEIFSRIRWIKISCYIGIAITAVFYLIFMACSIYWSYPHRGETFVQHYLIAANSLKTQELSIPTAAVGLGIDIYLFLVPYLAVRKLKMQRRKKVAVVLIFATGFLAIVASILSVIYRVILNRDPDTTWNVTAVWSLTAAELSIGMIIACTPHFSKLFRGHSELFSRFGSVMRYWLCCFCMSWKEMDSRRSRRWSRRSDEKTGKSSGKSSSGKSSQEGETTQTSEAAEKPKKATKLYPGLDISTVDRSAWQDEIRE